ncbi:acyl-CoA dehydrogenase family protein [Polymorphospora rubra]|uniref:Acyl-CoA dehydrogenase/oxidase C-terminal domain-containing protein n=2 Tax=Polymorphospora rubra TaxID=338584 RepID=A0A810N8S2_9ACTN|nr:acyl-CoA dehydrogenase family protein [Polymorphospora rubra]BCJ68003.1 hypothetical protein Prubr_50240 [Polymorphospora rubra]
MLVEREAMTTRPLDRTGLGGALTRSVRFAEAAPAATVRRLRDVDVAAARARLRRGAAAVAAGIAGAAADAAAAYAAERHQFGGPLTNLPTVRQSLLDQATRTAVALTTALGTDDGSVQTLAAMRHACDAAIEVAAAALQSHGGYGYLTEYPAERYLRDAVSLRAATDTHAAAAPAFRALVGPGPRREDGMS